MSLSARLFAIVSGIFLLVSSLATPAFAQTTNPYSSLMKTDGSVTPNIQTLTQGIFVGMLSFGTCLLGGVDFASPTHTCLTYNAKTQTFSYAKDTNGGLLGLTAGGIAFTYNSPFHTTDYLNYMAGNFGLVKKADAATGYQALSPIMNLWIAFRNVAYLLFVVVFVITGFAIMLRAKIDPRTVMTIENQIPKLIVALVLITFSFAIAGLVIDIMWVGVYLVINLFASLDPVLKQQVISITGTVTDNPFNWLDTLNSGPFGFLGIAQQAAGGIKDIATSVAFNFFQNAGFLKIFVITSVGFPILLSCALGGIANGLGEAVKNAPLVGGFVQFFQGLGSAVSGAGQSSTQSAAQNFGACIDAGFGTLVGTLIGGVAFIIFAIALLVALAKLWWTLIKSYALFLIFVILSPLAIIGGVIPGTKVNFEYWLRHILAYTIVFPTSMAIFLLGKTLMDVYSSNQVGGVPPLFGVTGNVTSYMGPLLGFAVMMLAPQSLHMVQDALNAPDPKYLAGIGQAIGVGAQTYGAGVGKLWDRSFRASDPLHNLDEGWARKLLLPKNSFIRNLVIGRETGTNIQPNKLGGSPH